MTTLFNINPNAPPSLWRSAVVSTGRLVRTTGLRLGKGQRRNRRRRVGVDFVPFSLRDLIAAIGKHAEVKE